MSQHFWGFQKIRLAGNLVKVISDAPPLLFLDHVHLDPSTFLMFSPCPL